MTQSFCCTCPDEQGPIEHQLGGLQNAARYRKIILDRDIEVQEA